MRVTISKAMNSHISSVYWTDTDMKYAIETNYGYGWEVESEYDTLEAAQADLEEYQLMTKAYGGSARIVESEETL